MYEGLEVASFGHRLAMTALVLRAREPLLRDSALAAPVAWLGPISLEMRGLFGSSHRGEIHTENISHALSRDSARRGDHC